MVAVLISGCKKQSENNDESAPYTPSGKLTDLMYNPVRADGSVDSSYLPIITWSEKEFDFGDLIKGEVAKKEFKFVNSGTAPIIISRATSSCGCSVPKWPKHLIQPDSSGVIEVEFNTANLEGKQMKEVTIFANTIPNSEVLRFHANVLASK